MRIYITDISEKGIEVKKKFDSTLIDFEREDAYISRPFYVDAFIQKKGKNITVRVNFKGTIELICSRCLIEYNLDIEKQFSLLYTIGNEKFIDLTDDIRQEIIFEYPVKPLCDKNCKGLCVNCGINLNKRKCSCK